MCLSVVFPSSVVLFNSLEVDLERDKSYIVRYKSINPRKGCVVDPVSGEFIRQRVEGKVSIKW